MQDFGDPRSWTFNIKELGLTDRHIELAFGKLPSAHEITVWNTNGLSQPTVKLGTQSELRLRVPSDKIPHDDPQRAKYFENVKVILRDYLISNVGWLEPRIRRAGLDISDDFAYRGFHDSGYSFQLPVEVGPRKEKRYINVVEHIGRWFDSDDAPASTESEYTLDTINFVPDWTRENVDRFMRVAKTYLSHITGTNKIVAQYSVVDKDVQPNRRVVVFVDDPDSIYNTQAVGYEFINQSAVDLYRATIHDSLKKNLQQLDI